MSAFTDTNRTPIVKPLSGSINGIGPGQTAVVKIPPGSTYNELILECRIAGVAATRAELIAMFPSLRLTVGGAEKWTMSAAQLIAITEYYRTGSIGDTGYLIIPFERLWMDGIAPKLNPAFGMLGEDSFQLEITQAAGSTIDTIGVWARINPVAEELGAHVKVVRLTPNIASTGTYIYPDLHKLPGDYLYALHIQVPVVANLTGIRYIADNVRLIDTTPALLNRLATLCNPPRTPQTAGLFVHLDFCTRNIDSDAVNLNMASQILELDFANAAPGQVNILAEIGTVQASRVSRPA